MPEAAQSFDHRVLCLGLASVDYVVRPFHVAEVRMLGFSVLGGNPALVAVWVGVKLAISKVAPEEPELPHVKSDVFADVPDGAVRANDYFLARVFVP